MITSSLLNAHDNRDERRPFLYTRRSAQGGGNFADSREYRSAIVAKHDNRLSAITVTRGSLLRCFFSADPPPRCSLRRREGVPLPPSIASRSSSRFAFPRILSGTAPVQLGAHDCTACISVDDLFLYLSTSPSSPSIPPRRDGETSTATGAGARPVPSSRRSGARPTS